MDERERRLMIDDLIDTYLRESEYVKKKTSSTDDDLDEYVREKEGITDRRKRRERVEEILSLLIEGGIINE